MLLGSARWVSGGGSESRRRDSCGSMMMVCRFSSDVVLSLVNSVRCEVGNVNILNNNVRNEEDKIRQYLVQNIDKKPD